MPRWQVEIVLIRARDVTVGDVVARDANAQAGWFRVHAVNPLPDGQINVLDRDNVRSFIMGPFDLVALQTPAPIGGVGTAAEPSSGPTAQVPQREANQREAAAKRMREAPRVAPEGLPPSSQ